MVTLHIHITKFRLVLFETWTSSRKNKMKFIKRLAIQCLQDRYFTVFSIVVITVAVVCWVDTNESYFFCWLRCLCVNPTHKSVQQRESVRKNLKRVVQIMLHIWITVCIGIVWFFSWNFYFWLVVCFKTTKNTNDRREHFMEIWKGKIIEELTLFIVIHTKVNLRNRFSLFVGCS